MTTLYGDGTNQNHDDDDEDAIFENRIMDKAHDVESF